MKESFEELYKLMQLNCQYSQWTLQTSMKGHAEELKSEIDEMIAEINNGDYKQFQEELGDVFWNLLKLMVISENKGIFNIKNLFEQTHAKFKRRKPYLLEGKIVSREEEHNIWKEVKEQEKNERK